MSAAQILGAIIVAAPFVALFVLVGREVGWLEAVGTFAACAALTAILGIGSYLLTGGA